MTKRVTAIDIQTQILPLLDEVAAGQTIEITKRGRTVARLVPPAVARSAKAKIPAGK